MIIRIPDGPVFGGSLYLTNPIFEGSILVGTRYLKTGLRIPAVVLKSNKNLENPTYLHKTTKSDALPPGSVASVHDQIGARSKY
jgi:hypothetical protein